MTGRRELTIGEFARRSRLPVTTLRYYDRIGLLTPTFVDPRSGYRRYTVDQLPAAMLISHLRSLGVPPDGIARILAGGPSASAVLRGERRRIEEQIEAGHRRLRQLDELLAAGIQIGHDVEVVTLGAREVAVLPFLLPAAGLERGVTRAIARLRSVLRRGGHRPTGPWGATFPTDPADEISGFVFAPVDGVRPEGLDTAWLPAGRAVTTAHRGGPATLPLAYHAAFASLDALCACPVGPMIEEYVQLDDSADRTPMVRLCVPIDEPPPAAGPDRR